MNPVVEALHIFSGSDAAHPGRTSRNFHFAGAYAYFQTALCGFEVETFGVEIARLCLGLADFPNANGWKLYEEDVFTSPRFNNAIQSAKVVLCNPPFQSLDVGDPIRQHVKSVHKAAEILGRVLTHLPDDGVLGFVLPRRFLDSPRYREVRTKLVKRFAHLHIVSLPDVAFRSSEAQHETILLLASHPQRQGAASTVLHRRVAKQDWDRFNTLHKATTDDVVLKTSADAAQSLSVPPLAEIWSYLDGMPRLREFTKTTSRGLQWNIPLRAEGNETGNRNKLVFGSPQHGAKEGIPPLAKIECFQEPETKYLNVQPEFQRRNAYLAEWALPKVIVNANRRSRGPWRLSAFADSRGLTCAEAFIAIWPKDDSLTTTLAAVLNSPLANAYASTFEGAKFGQTQLLRIPVPFFSQTQRKAVDASVQAYLDAIKKSDLSRANTELRRVDALILKAYDLPPRLERKVIELFRGETRPVPFEFTDYYPKDYDLYFSLADYLSSEFQAATAGALRARLQTPPGYVVEAMRAAVESFEED
ncbi:MAG: hypothetical protein U0744_02455 [Gemmataceae bacterium]